ncbi:MAG: hypothetical protein H7Y20_13155 [Bryobacteraceae bacterium]|nr:hypothetical protein [Bryobacteraceae bacterium]
MKTYTKSFLSICLVAASFGATAQATTINGELNITGSVTVTATTIDFQPGGGTDGLFQVDPFSQTGFFNLGGLPGSLGAVKDLDVIAQPVDDFGFTTGTGPLLNFLLFAANPALKFDLLFIQSGAGTLADCALPAAGGQVCTITGSPFTLTNTSTTSSTASFRVRGTVDDGGPVSTFVGEFSTQFPTQNLQEVLATLGSAGSITKSFAGTFVVTAIPEPGTTSLLVAGSILLLVGRFMRSRSSKA